MKNLTVYRASAGSGKTFTLALEYIKLLVENPQSFRQTLAVTFTNKATEEMKMRILSDLYGISKGLKNSDALLEKIKESSVFSEKQIRDRAWLSLQLLIHNYNYFRVETIDAFFQTVLRNLAKELDLSANLKIELNDAQVEQQAVDELIESLDETSLMLYWILEYIHENIEDDKSWNVISQIKNFGLNIFKDYYKKNQKELSQILEQKDFFKNYSQKLRNIRNKAKAQLTELADNFFDTLEANGFAVDDFSRKSSGPCGYFIKLKSGDFVDDDKIFNKTAQEASFIPERWVIKKLAKPGEPIYDFVCDTLMQMLNNAENIRVKQVKLYKSADLTLRHLSQLRLLGCIGDKVTELNNEVNRFMLSDTQTLLSSMIEDSDSPFIFEKIGTQLENIMIDEFQDTSTVQWENFKVLLKETMSRDGNNLIVGDVKQSIYRWRSGDWRLLNDIDKQFDEGNVSECSLATNYRSSKNIIRFNNEFFKCASEIEYQELSEICGQEAEQMKKAYADVEQQIPESKIKEDVGNVEIKLLPDEDYTENMLSQTLEKVRELKLSGVADKDIAILVRTNPLIRLVGDYFMQNMPEAQLVSDEAFHLDASQAVNIMVYAMKVLAMPDDEIALASLVKIYATSIKSNTLKDNDIFLNSEYSVSLLPKEFLNKKDELLGLPLMELAEALFSIFDLSILDSQNAYICTFYDKLGEYMQDGIPDLSNFLVKWDDNIHNCSIQSSNENGIRLITIHKSKGLEFRFVIMPFCDWKLEKNNVIWCQPSVSPYNELPLVPIDFSKKQMLGSIYEADYTHEHLQNMVDNLNLLYVAFTRAEIGLYIFGKRDKNGTTRSAIIEECIDSVSNILGANVLGDSADYNQPIEFEFGKLPQDLLVKEKNDDGNIFRTVSKNETLSIINYENNVKFRQSNKSDEFIKSGIEDEQAIQKNEFIHVGNVMHSILSEIQTEEDIDNSLRKLEEEGIVYDNNITAEKLQKMLRDSFNIKIVKDWFSDKWQVFNECSILKVNPDNNKVEVKRPDRVMTDGKQMIVIDFKFAAPKEEHKSQVKEYMQLLNDMGYSNIHGYLWYVYSKNIIEIK
ncbi:MAG: UvrD-helicase domain-containing protein [Prevotella sp.]|jgi:ATP-dependent exoDNAse (exonuclease V) beta subunit|nr:UvrD-helicase domain-containing protein [Prevotella sp.]MBP9982783.1 UvrD-helicase domain-containing protein [Prevotella sp.]MCI1732433.1 UvrD-helicase domain-containing protein [Prevotella sp.]